MVPVATGDAVIDLDFLGWVSPPSDTGFVARAIEDGKARVLGKARVGLAQFAQ